MAPAAELDREGVVMGETVDIRTTTAVTTVIRLSEAFVSVTTE